MTAPKGKKQKRCIFCGGPNVSKEHFYSDWMGGMFKDSGQGHVVENITNHPVHGEMKRVRKERPAPMQTKKIRAPCAECNNGWMNRLEAAARPYLTAMIAGELITLNLVAQIAVAKWIALKVMVVEHTDQEIAVTPQEDRTAFMTEGRIPPYYRIYIGGHRSNADMGYMRHSATASLDIKGPVPPLNGMRRNVQQISFLAGRMFAHVNAARIDGFDIEDRVKVVFVHDFMRLWPMQRFDFNFPEGLLLGDAELRQLSNSWAALRDSPHMAWGGDLPE